MALGPLVTMSERPVDIDALFDRLADARLLERRRREELGLPPLPDRLSSTPARFGPESMMNGDEPALPERGPVVRVELAAQPRTELIPGALVTIVVDVHDDGDADAADAILRIALPFECEPLAGSFTRDDVVLDADALLGEGMRIGTIPAHALVRIRFSIRILPGTEPLDIVAFVTTKGIPTIAAPSLRLGRRSGHTAFADTRPFFELEPGETDDEIDTTESIAEQRLVDALLDQPANPEPPEPTPVPVVGAGPQPPPIPELPPYVLSRDIDAEEVRALERVFVGAIPHGLAALALLSSIAGIESHLAEALGLREFALEIASALPRALVSARMQRPTPPVVTAAALGAIKPRADVVRDGSRLSAPSLTARLQANDLDALRAVLARGLDDPLLRGVQVLLAILPRTVENVPERAAAGVAEALAAYRIAAGAWLMRVTVRRAVDRNYDPLTADDPSLHTAGRAVVAALRSAIT